MCYYQGLSVGEYCSACQRCDLYLSVCIPIVVGDGIVSAECDNVDFCMYCPSYYECEVLWKGAEVI